MIVAEPEAAPRPRNGAYHPPEALDDPPMPAVPADDPPPDHPRGSLALAIAKHIAALDALAKIQEAQGRAPASWEANSAVEAAQSALAEARAGEGPFLVAQLMGEDVGENPVTAATAALEAAEAALVRARSIRGLLDERQRTAEAKVAWEASMVRNAVAEALRADPAVSGLLASFEETKRQAGVIRACLRAVSTAGGISDRFWDAREEPDGAADPEAAAWRTAIAALATDPDAELP